MKREHQVCGWCDELILPGERTFVGGNFVNHYECGMRSIIGGLNHIEGRCSCCGGTEPPDPPGVSRREAARLALAAWERRQR